MYCMKIVYWVRMGVGLAERWYKCTLVYHYYLDTGTTYWPRYTYIVRDITYVTLILPFP